MVVIEQKKLGDILHLQQNISQVNASLVKNELQAIVNASNCDCLWLDMSQVSFIDSVGLGIIATTYSLLKQQNRSLILCKVNASVNLVFELTGLDQVFQFSSTVPRSSAFEFSHLNKQWSTISVSLSTN